MLRIGSRFSENPVFDGTQRTKRGEVYAKEANALLDLRHVSLSTVQACVLLGATSISDGEAMAETIFYSAACRIANCLDLPNTKSSCPVTREVCLRGQSVALGDIRAVLLSKLSVLDSLYD